MDAKSFVMYKEWLGDLDELTTEQRGQLLTAVLQWQSGVDVDALELAPRIVFNSWVRHFERNALKWEQTRQKRAEAGRMGGHRKAENLANLANASKAKQKVANLAVNVNGNVNANVNGNGNVNENVIENKSNAPSPARHKYGFYNNVLLSDEERDKLKVEYPDYERTLEELSAYIASTGKRYKSHYATIRNWRRKEQQKGGVFVGESAGLDGIKLNITTV